MTTALGSIQDFAKRDGKSNSREWVKHFSAEKVRTGQLARAWDGRVNERHPIALARIDAGRWLADCPFCGLSCMVDPDDDFFFCLYCAGNGTGEAGKARFPENREEIEAAILERPVITRGRHGSFADEQLHAVPVVMARNWVQGQTVDDLRIEFEFVVAEIARSQEIVEVVPAPEIPAEEIIQLSE